MTEIADVPGLHFPDFPSDFTASSLGPARPETWRALGLLLDEVWENIPMSHSDVAVVEFQDCDSENSAGSIEVYCQSISPKSGGQFECAEVTVACEPNLEFVWPCCGEQSPIRDGALVGRIVAQQAMENPQDALWLMRAYDLASGELATDVGEVRRLMMRSPTGVECSDVQYCHLFFDNGAKLTGTREELAANDNLDELPSDYRWMHLKLSDHPNKTDYQYSCRLDGTQQLGIRGRNVRTQPRAVAGRDGQEELLDRRSVEPCEWSVQRFARALHAALQGESASI